MVITFGSLPLQLRFDGGGLTKSCCFLFVLLLFHLFIAVAEGSAVRCYCTNIITLLAFEAPLWKQSRFGTISFLEPGRVSVVAIIVFVKVLVLCFT